MKSGSTRKIARGISIALFGFLIVGCSSAAIDEQAGKGDQQPEVTETDTAAMFAAVASQLCLPERCGNHYDVLDDFSGNNELSGVRIPAYVKEAIAEALGAVSFVPPDQRVPGTMLLVGPMTLRRPDLVSIWGGASCGPFCGGGTEYLFIWEDGRWVPISAEDAGVVIMSWVS